MERLKRVYSAEERERRNYEERTSKQRLLKSLIKKIQTTMIGSIASIESYMNNYMDDPEFMDLFTQLREEILDKGNEQIRLLKNELREYTINWNRYEYKMSINSREN
jgi:hypothetical protein